MRMEKRRHVSGAIAVLTALMLVMACAVCISHAGEKSLGYIPANLEISEADEGLNDKGGFYLKKGTLPSRYSSLDYSWYPTYIKDKDQGNYGICFAFSSTSAAEISYSKETGKACTQTSPGHLAWYGYNTLTDPLGLTTGDGIKLTGYTAWNFGGNAYWNMLNVARGIGMAQLNSSTNPMLPASDSYKYPSTGAYDKTVLSVENVDILDKKSSESTLDFVSRVKEEVYEHGAVDVSMYWDDNAYTSSSNSYYYSGTSADITINHGVTIVGWNDDYSTRASQKGAWIVQNSWGASPGGLSFDRGTFYVSYYDTRIIFDGAYVWDMYAGGTYSQRYQYDGGVSGDSYTVLNGQWAANIYQVPSNSNLSLEAVSFAELTEGNVKYDIEVYKDVTAGKPVSGTKAATLSGVSTSHAGYHTFKLDSPVLMTGGTRYSIVVKPKSTVFIASDKNRKFDGFELAAAISSGQSYRGSDSSCTDVADWNTCFRIKGLGNTFNVVDLAAASVSIGAQTYTGSAITPAVNIGGLAQGRDFTVAYSDNINTGTGKAVITAKSLRCRGSKTVLFTIKAADISTSDASVTPDRYTYGDNISPEITVKHGGKTLIAGKDFTAAYAKGGGYTGSDSSGRYISDRITITGIGNFTGVKYLEVKGYQADINSAEARLKEVYTYTGKYMCPAPVVTYKGRTLVRDTDYTLVWKNNTEVGTATVLITGKTNFKGTKTITFDIKRDITQAAVTGGFGEVYYAYEARDITPAAKLTWNSIPLTEGIDYTVSFRNNKDIGTAGVIITGKGHYTGTITKTFIIKPRQISQVDMGMAGPFTYRGSAFMPDISLTCNGVRLVKGIDYELDYKNNVNAGQMTITIAGKGNYAGGNSINVNISKLDISDPMNEAAAVLSSESYQYTGSDIKPSPVVTYNGMTLLEGTDYRLLYSNNREIGTASVKIIALDGNYTGTMDLAYEIEPADISRAKASLPAVSYMYSGEKYSPVPALTYNGRELAEGVDYTVSYVNNVNAGTASVVIEGKGYFTGTKTVKFKILPLSITKMTLSSSSFVYDGKYKYPKVAIYQESNKLASGITRSNGNVTLTMSLKKKSPGTYTVKVTGKGNYTGTISRTYRIFVKQAKVASLTSRSKGFTVVCSKLSGTYVTGYQVRYSTSGSMKSAKTVTIGTKAGTVSKTVSSLKAKKTYYVQVRSYKTINGKKYYSEWSEKKSVTTK